MATDGDVPRPADASDRESGARDEADGRDTDDNEARASGDHSGDRHARPDARSVGTSVERSPATSFASSARRQPFPGRQRPSPRAELLYLTEIAVLRRRVAALEATVAEKEHDLQHVIDRYEHVLDGRGARRDDPLVDLARESTDRESTDRESTDRESTDRESTDRERSLDERLADRLRALVR
jgi:hypothetical protein